MLDCSQRTLFEHPDGLIDKYLVHNMQASASVTHHRGEEVKGLESLPFLSSSHTHTHKAECLLFHPTVTNRW